MTTPFQAGQSLTAGALNLRLDPPLAHLFAVAAQSVPNATWTPILLDSELLDSHNGHSTSTNTSRYVCQRAGVYEFGGSLSWLQNATGLRLGRIRINGSTAILGSLELRNAVNGDYTCMALPACKARLALGDYVELEGYQSSGGALSTDDTAAGAGCALTVAYIGP